MTEATNREETEVKIIVVEDQPLVWAGEVAKVNAARGIEVPEHDCWDHPVPYVSDGPLGHGFECGLCGGFLQAG